MFISWRNNLAFKFVQHVCLFATKGSNAMHDAAARSPSFLRSILSRFLGGGDFYKKDIYEAICDYAEIDLINTSPTRQDATLDLCPTNFNNELVECLNHAPLVSDSGTRSDHNFLSFRYAIQHLHKFTWIRYKTRHITDQAEATSLRELEVLDWSLEIPSGLDVHHAAANFHRLLYSLTNKNFPIKWHRVRSTDDPWIDAATRAMIDKRQKMFNRTKKRCCRWKKLKTTTDNMIRRRKKKYYDREVEKLCTVGSHQIPYKALRNIADTERPPSWTIEHLARTRSPPACSGREGRQLLQLHQPGISPAR